MVIAQTSLDDKCPVCKSDKYLNPNLKFLVNPECYHKMCETCIDRIFTLGPAPCPQCGRMLRKAKFRKQTFEDTLVEREVDVRRRITKLFNKRREDFKNLREYNDYLEDVEEIIFNLVNGTDLKETEAKVSAYELANRTSIATNAARQLSEQASLQKQEDSIRAQREAARLAALKEEADEQYERDRQRTDLIRDLASSEGSAEKILARNKAAALKRSSARRQNEETRLSAAAGGFTFPGMATGSVQMEEEEGPFDPLGGEGKESGLYRVKTTYEDKWLEPLSHDEKALAGGFLVHDVYRRGLFEAYAGLGCILSEELAAN